MDFVSGVETREEKGRESQVVEYNWETRNWAKEHSPLRPPSLRDLTVLVEEGAGGLR